MDKKQIVSIVKDQGIDLGEDMAVAAVKSAIGLIKVIVPQLSKGAGTMVNLFLGAYEDDIYRLLDKIDGKVDLD